MMKVITFANQKGGIGKTTMAVNVADGLSRQGFTTLLMDLDPQGHCAVFLGQEPCNAMFGVLLGATSITSKAKRLTEHLHLLSGHKRTASAQILLGSEPPGVNHLHDILKDVRSEYDFVIMDTPPSVGSLQEMAVWASDFVMIPCQTHAASLDGLASIRDSATNLKSKHGWRGSIGGIIPTFYDQRTKESDVQLQHMRDAFGDLVTPVIHANVRFSEATAYGKSIFGYAEDKNDASTKRAVEETAEIVWWVRDL